jgi:hypothetical protein
MINAYEFKKAMRELIPEKLIPENFPCPSGLCSNCNLHLGASVGIVDCSGELDKTRCLIMLARHLDRQWKKQEAHGS